MDPATDLEAVEDSARQLLDARIAAVRELAAAQGDVARAREALGAAKTAHAASYAAATRAGWTDAELKQVGLGAPQRRAPGRPRRARTRRAASTANSADKGPAGPNGG